MQTYPAQPRQAILILGSGGSLGAFECGACQVLLPWLRAHGIRLAAIAGASVGALNAALIARHARDGAGGLDQLTAFWSQLRCPSYPFFPLPGSYWDAWNGALTGLLLGSPHTQRPVPAGWNPVGDALRLQWPLYDNRPLARTVAAFFGDYEGRDPILVVRAQQVETGLPVVFDSLSGPVTHGMLMGSAAIPMLYAPTRVSDSHYWDGDLWSNTLLPDVLSVLRHDPARPEGIGDCLVIDVSLFQPDWDQDDPLPISTLQIAHRLIHTIEGGKPDYDRRQSEPVNRYLDFVERAKQLAADQPASPLTRWIDETHARLRAERRMHLSFLPVRRRSLPHEHLLRTFDYSPDWLDALEQQGQDCARAALATWSPTDARRIPERMEV